MAQFQLSVSKTYTLDTNDWGQTGRDHFGVALEKVGFDGKGQPTTQQCEDAIRWILEDDEGDFWDAHINLDEIEPKDVKVVCFSRQFDRFETKEDPNAKPEAPKTPIPPNSPAKTQPGPSASTTKPGSPPVSPAPKVTSGSVIQGARDSTQVKK